MGKGRNQRQQEEARELYNKWRKSCTTENPNGDVGFYQDLLTYKKQVCLRWSKLGLSQEFKGYIKPAMERLEESIVA
ncbi:MAG: hypothetical protein OEX08_02715 [Candidatus Nomurabacteria bacterium]|nr:hypothetical protein [Candidatus Nomurabacteria bacterium]